MHPPFLLCKLFTQFFEFIRYKLYLCSDNNLYVCFARTDNTCNTCSFDLFLIYLCGVFDLKTKSCDAVVDCSYVVCSAYALKDCFCNCCEVIVCKNNFCFIFCVVIFTSRSFQIEFNDRETEYYVEYDKCCDSKRNDQPCLSSCRQRCGEQKVCCTCRERESCTEA